MIHVYGICEAVAADPPPSRRGLGGARLRAVRRRDLAAVYSRHRGAEERPSSGLVLAHERVLRAVMERGPVLPARFGTRLESEEEVAVALDERREPILRALERVRGRVELGVRVLAAGRERSGGGAASAVSGREYLLGRVAEHRRGERVARELHAPLSELAAESSSSEHPSPPAILVASYLVPEADVDRFRKRADALGRRQNGVRVVVTGPWAPYSFAGEGLS